MNGIGTVDFEAVGTSTHVSCTRAPLSSDRCWRTMHASGGHGQHVVSVSTMDGTNVRRRG